MAEQTILIAEDDPDIRDGVLDDVTNLISTAASSTTNTGSGSSTSNTTGSGASDLVAGAVESVMPSTSTLLYGLVDGSIGSTLWESVTSSTASIMAVNSICSIRSLFASYLSQNTPNSTHATAHAQEPAALHIG